MPDDYAVRLLPVILSSFQRTHPKIVVDVRCQPSEELLEGMKTGKYDLIVFTQGTNQRIRRAVPHRADVLGRVAWRPRRCSTDPLPIAGGQPLLLADNAIEVLNRIGRDYRIAYTSSNAIAIASAVLTDLAVGFLPESALQPGMRVIAEDKDLPRLRDAEIALHAREPRLWRHLRCARQPHRHQHGQSRRQATPLPVRGAE